MMISADRLSVVAGARERLNIALLNSLYPPIAVGGAEKVVQCLAEALSKSHHRVSVITLCPEESERVDRLGGVTVIRLPTDVPWPFGTSYKSVARRVRTKLADRYSGAMYARVRSVLAELRPDIVHTNSLLGFSTSVWDAAGSLGIPIVHTAHDWYLPCIRSTMLQGGRACARQCASCSLYTRRRRSASARVGAFVGVSEFVRRTHLNCGFFNGTTTAVIHNARPARRRAQYLRTCPNGPLRLGFLGRIEAAKGIELLLETLRPLKASVNLRIGGAGNAELVERLKTQYVDDRFVWAGRVDPREFYREIDVLVVPSIWNEPFGLVIGEAHSEGIPVIASRRGGMPEIVQDGTTGFLFDPDRPAELADIITRISVDRSLVTAMSAAIMAQAPGPAADDWAAAYENLYLEIVGRHAHSVAAQ